MRLSCIDKNENKQMHWIEWVISVRKRFLECFDLISVLNFRSLNATKMLKCSHRITFSFQDGCDACIRPSVWAMLLESGWWAHAFRAYMADGASPISMVSYSHSLICSIISPGNNEVKWYRNQVAVDRYNSISNSSPLHFECFTFLKKTDNFISPISTANHLFFSFSFSISLPFAT